MKSKDHQNTIIKVRPVIKWTGGKYDEFREFSQFIPEFKNYYEAFFGGGGVFFALQPKGIAYLNDKSTDLCRFYELISNNSTSFNRQLNYYAEAWDQATILSKQISKKLLDAFVDYIDHTIDKSALSGIITEYIDSIDKSQFKPLFQKQFIVNPVDFVFFLINSLNDKFKRIKQIQQKENKRFLEHELLDHVETGVKSGLYLYLRKLTNDVARGRLEMAPEKAVANWYFIREFCYASMFRYNKNGEFNIPYGGIAYNKKNFRAKVETIFSKPVKNLMKHAIFFNEDFEKFMKQTAPSADDFVFLDPPYDSEFSEYDQNTFTRDDQVRLRNSILKCKAKCMVVIKETPFIRALYSSAPFYIVDFDKTYTYNVRGRNERGTKHLIILNYQHKSNGIFS